MDNDINFKYFSKPWGVRKIMWTLLVIGGVIASSNDIVQAVSRYLMKPINTFTTLRYPTEIAFPQLILCNSNQFRITEAEKDLYPLITEAFEYPNRSTFRIEDYDSEIKSAINNTGSNVAGKYRKRVAHKIDDMIIKCTTWTGVNCSANFTEEIYDYGVCYQLNGSAFRSITQPGSGQCLTMFLNLESYQHMQGPANFLNSLKVTISHLGVRPYVTARGFNIPPGYMSMISLKYNEYTRVLSKHGGSCIEKQDLEYFDTELYSSDTCQLNLAFKEIEKNCKCKPYYATAKRQVEYCNIVQHFNCVIWQDLAARNASQCNQTCVTIEYDIFLSSAKIPPSIWPSLIDDQKKKIIDNAFNDSMESFSRHDKFQKLKLINLINNVRNAMDNLTSLNMTPPTNNDETVKEASRIGAPQCYQEVLIKYDYLFDEFKEKGYFDSECTSGTSPSQLLAPKGQVTEVKYDLTITKLIQAFTTNSSLWDLLRMSEAFDSPRALNESHQFYKSHVPFVMNTVKTLVTFYKSPLCLLKPIGLVGYWQNRNFMDMYENKTKKLKQWVDEHSTGLGEQYLTKYASEFTSVYYNALSTLATIHKQGKNVSGFVLQSRFWNYFGIYLDAVTHIYNRSACVNKTYDGLSERCSSYPWYSMESFFNDLVNCSNHDFETPISKIIKDITEAANKYKSAADDLDDFLMSYGRRWAFGNDFFSDNIVGLKVYFGDLSQRALVEEAAYSLTNMFGDIGGSMGLFIGASVLTIFEFLDIMIWEIRKLKVKYLAAKARRVGVKNADVGKVEQTEFK